MRRGVGVLVLFVLLGLLFGCGGSGGGGTATTTGGATSTGGSTGGGPQTPRQQIDAGANSLGELVVPNPDLSNNARYARLEQASNSFRAAAQATTNPTESAQANVGFAFAELSYTAETLARNFGTSLFSLPQLQSRSGSMGGFAWQGAAFVPDFKRKDFDELLPLRTIVTAGLRRSSRATNVTPATIKAAAREVRAQLPDLEARLTDARIQELTNNPLLIPFQGNTLAVGAAEALALRSALRALIGAANLILAYEIDYGTFNVSESFGTKYAAAIANDAPIPASELLPAGDFLRRTTNGNTLLSDMRTLWIAAANDAQAAIQNLRTRGTARQWFANRYIDPNRNLDLDLEEIARFRDFLTGQQVITLTTPRGASLVTVNVSAWLDGSAPADLRNTFFADIQALAGEGGFSLGPVIGSIEDATYEGLVPQGLPEDALYNRVRVVGAGESFTVADAVLFAMNVTA